MSFEGKILTGVDCGNAFAFTVEDQQYHAQKGYTKEPKRSTSCRETRRQARGYGSSGGGYAYRGMYSVVCAQCGKETQVPCQPRGDRPVYRRGCYSQKAATHAALLEEIQEGS